MIRWGISGTGTMAEALAGVIGHLPDAIVAAVGSGSPRRAREFADRHGIAVAHGSHVAVATDPGVDVLYAAGTNETHHGVVLAAVAAGIPVLCEKPIALDRRQAAEMAGAARAAGVFLMEGMWMVFQPFLGVIRDLIEAGEIGPLRHISADFGFPHRSAPGGRLLNPRLGGGSLLDIGVYPLTLIHLLAGLPEDFAAVSVPSGTGVDLQTAVVSRHPGGIVSIASSSLAADTVLEAVVSGPQGRIRVHAPFHQSTVVTVERAGQVASRHEVADLGYRPEVEEVHRCLGSGETESPVRPLGDTLAVMGWMDGIREQIGLRHPRDGVPRVTAT